LYTLKGNFFPIFSGILSVSDDVEINSIDNSVGFMVGGFPLNVATLACGFISMRVVYEILISPSTFRNYIPSRLILLWLIGLIPALILFLWSWKLGNPNWTRGYRFYLISGSYFYGVILFKNFKMSNFKMSHERSILKLFIPLLIIYLLIIFLEVFWSHFGFLLIGLTGAFSIFLLYEKIISYKIIGLFLFSLTVIIILKSSLTLMLIGFISILFTLLICNAVGKNYAQRFLVSTTKMLLPVSILFTLFVSILSYILDISILVQSEQSHSFMERVLWKTLFDRLPFWSAAFEQIISGPYFLVPSGRPFYINSIFYGTDVEWVVGAHNSYLEILRNTGLFVGLVILIVYITAINNVLKVLRRSENRLLRTFSSAIISVSIVGLSVGDFPADMTMGFFLWSFAGFIHCNYVSMTNKI
jgi:hypothetical protein